MKSNLPGSYVRSSALWKAEPEGISGNDTMNVTRRICRGLSSQKRRTKPRPLIDLFVETSDASREMLEADVPTFREHLSKAGDTGKSESLRGEK